MGNFLWNDVRDHNKTIYTFNIVSQIITSLQISLSSIAFEIIFEI